VTADESTLAMLAASDLDELDVAFLDRLSTLVERADPVPAGLVDRIGLALTIDALHAEVAELRTAAAEPAMRADEASIEARTITFTTEVLTVMISIQTEADRVRVDGWASPAQVLTVELHQAGVVLPTPSDEDGRFSFSDLGRGPARLVLRRSEEGAVPVVTPQIEL